MKIRDNQLCSFCNVCDETVEHLFWGCQVISSFWLDVEKFFLKQQFFFSKEDIYFGYKQLRRHPYNFLIFNVKYYIYQQKQANALPKIEDFFFKFKFSIEVEKRISRNNRDKTKRYVSFEELKETFAVCEMLFNDDN